MRALRRMPLAAFWAFDCLVSALTSGDVGQTLSARLGKARAKGSPVATVCADALDVFIARVLGGRNRCASSIAAYEARLNAAAFTG